ncbi:hypothetical protein FACS189414_4740 [Bacteroidia bacterium]|nr:hypothetical protein FACS189414_4740 [Bacteroidia bacterium]
MIPYNLSQLPEEKKAVKKLAVSQYTFGGIYLASYGSITEVSMKTGISTAAIGQNTRGKTSHTGGFIWQMGESGKSWTGKLCRNMQVFPAQSVNMTKTTALRVISDHKGCSKIERFRL